MKRFIFILFLVAFPTAFADQNNCAKMLEQSSQSWITQATQKQGGSNLNLNKAISQYASCVDQDIQNLYAKMLKSGNYPLMGANGNFRDFTEALQNFTKLATKITATGGTWDATQAAYIQLYQKEFKLLFYQSYIGKNRDPLLNRIENAKHPNLIEAKKYFEKIILRFSPQQQKALNKAFNQLLTVATVENGFKKAFIYKYAIYILQPIEDKPFSPPPF